MRISDKAIVLQSVKHGDKKLILKLYTQQHGTITAIATAGRSSTAKVKSASIQPLNLIEAEFILKQNKEIHQLNEAISYHILSNIPNSLAKLSIAQFINEVLVKSLKEPIPNPDLYEFIEKCLLFLNDAEEQYVNIHLYFLIGLAGYLGFEPQNNFSAVSPFFDCREGRFSPVSLVFPLGLSKEDSILFSEFLKINILKTGLSNQQRQNLLDICLAYYKLHLPGFNEVKSLEVLRAVMAG